MPSWGLRARKSACDKKSSSFRKGLERLFPEPPPITVVGSQKALLVRKRLLCPSSRCCASLCLLQLKDRFYTWRWRMVRGPLWVRGRHGTVHVVTARIDSGRHLLSSCFTQRTFWWLSPCHGAVLHLSPCSLLGNQAKLI